MNFRAGIFLLTLGACASRKEVEVTDPYLYALPFSPGKKVPVYQGWGGSFSHRGPHEYAIDFALEKNSEVRAAREGTINEAVDRFVRGANDPKLLKEANYVIIAHEDGSEAEYFHLAPRSLRVKVGDQVKRNQVLALSGDTGFATIPHLHFMVFDRETGSRKKRSRPIKFRSVNEAPVTLHEGKSYSAWEE